MRSGYITDRNCPTNPEHGAVIGMRGGGHYCPNHAHDIDPQTKSYWTEDEFEAAKSSTTETAPVATLATRVKKLKRRVAKRSKR